MIAYVRKYVIMQYKKGYCNSVHWDKCQAHMAWVLRAPWAPDPH